VVECEPECRTVDSRGHQLTDEVHDEQLPVTLFVGWPPKQHHARFARPRRLFAVVRHPRQPPTIGDVAVFGKCLLKGVYLQVSAVAIRRRYRIGDTYHHRRHGDLPVDELAADQSRRVLRATAVIDLEAQILDQRPAHVVARAFHCVGAPCSVVGWRRRDGRARWARR
jgi:hypothetical protein